MTTFNRNLRLGYGISVLIVLAVSLVSYLTLQSLLSTHRAAAKSNLVMQKLEKVLSVIKDAETGQRGYLLSGRTSFPQPNNGSYTQTLKLANDLIILTADDPNQQQAVNTVKLILQQRLNIFQQLVVKKQRGEAITDSDLVAGKSAMDALRHAVAKAEAHEQTILRQQDDSFGTYAGLVPLFIILAAFAVIGVTLYSYRTVNRDYRDKERLRAEIEGVSS